MSNLLEDASIVITPTGYDNGTINATLPIPALGLDADLDFTRNGSANRTDSNGLVKSVSANIPRIDYSGQGNEFVDIGGVQTYRYVLGNLYPFEDPRGTYLFEGQSTNLIRNSNDFANGNWSKLDGSAIISDQAISPSGDLDADLLTFAELTTSRLERWITTVAATEYTISVYVKKATYDGRVSIGITGSTLINHTLTDEWVRMSFKVTASGTLSFPRISNTDGTQLDCYVYGWQMEEGDLTSYIPTEAATSTRLADKASKSNVGSFINSEEGTMIIEGFSSGTNGQITLSNGTPQDTMQIRFLSGDKIIFISKLNNSATSFIQSTSKLINVFYNIAVTWKTNEFKLYIDGALAGSGTGTVAAANTYNRLGLDRGNSGGSFFQGGFAKLEVWEEALTAAEIACQNTI